jgi:hypothetical protein
MLVYTKFTWHRNPEDNRWHLQCSDNLKSHPVLRAVCVLCSLVKQQNLSLWRSNSNALKIYRMPLCKIFHRWESVRRRCETPMVRQYPCYDVYLEAHIGM